MFPSHDCIFHVERVPTDWHFLFSACGFNMLPPRLSPLRHSHPCLSPTYTKSVFEGRFEVFRLSVRGTPTTHSEGLLLRVGRPITLCTYLQPWRGTARALHTFGTRTATRMQLEGRNVPCKQYCASGLQQGSPYLQYRVATRAPVNTPTQFCEGQTPENGIPPWFRATKEYT